MRFGATGYRVFMTERAIMPLSAKTALLAVTALFVAPIALAQERCSGTLCDAYYGNRTPDPAAPAGATPLTVPTGGILGFFTAPKTATPAGAPGQATAPAKAPYVQMEGGGLVGAMRGAPAERCSGTICDLFYGGPPPERPQQAATGAAPGIERGIDRSIDRGGDIDRAPRGRNRRASADEGSVSYAPRQVEKPQCAAPPNDPWRCYRK